MAGKKGTAAKTSKKKIKPAPKGKAASPGPADQSPGANLKIPTQKELEGFIKRLDDLWTQKGEANARYMSDIKAVYEEAANKFGCGRKIIRVIYGKKRAEESFADTVAEYENKDKDDMDRIMAGAAKLFGDDSPFGAWLNAQGKVKGVEHVPDKPKNTGKTAAEAAADAIAAEEREAAQTTH